MDNEKEIQEMINMDIHDSYFTFNVDGGEGDYEYTRVPGGWIYSKTVENGTGGFDMSSCFVPIPDKDKQ